MSVRIRYRLRLYLVRHGESTNNALSRTVPFETYMLQRSHDPTLSDVGEQQAALAAPVVARYLADDLEKLSQAHPAPLPTTLHCSPMWRAMQTAQPIARTLALDPIIHPDIFEHGGIFMRQVGEPAVAYPGADRAQIRSAFPDYVVPDVVTDGGWWRGGEESYAACWARADDVAQELHRIAQSVAAKDQRQHMVMVTHGTFMDLLIKAILGQSIDAAHHFYHNNTGITCLDFNQAGIEAAFDGEQRASIALRFTNRVDHLSDNDSTAITF